MNINAIRRLLLIKTSDVYLGSLIRQIDNESLATHILDSLEVLEKAKPKPSIDNIDYSHTLVTPNSTDLSSVAKQNRLAIRDAMGHHAARFGAAFSQLQKTEDPQQRRSLRVAANEHAKHFAKYQHFASHLDESVNSHGFSVDSPARAELNSDAGYQNASDNEKQQIEKKFKLGWRAPNIQSWQRDHRKQEEPNTRHHWDQSKSRIDAPGWQFFKNKKPSNHEVDGYFNTFTSLPTHAGAQNPSGDKHSEVISHYNGHAGDNPMYYHPDRGYEFHDGMYPFEHVEFDHAPINIKDQDVSSPEVFKPHFFDNMPVFATHGDKEKAEALKQQSGGMEDEHLWPEELPAHFYEQQDEPHYDSVFGEYGVKKRLDHPQWVSIKEDNIAARNKEDSEAMAGSLDTNVGDSIDDAFDVPRASEPLENKNENEGEDETASLRKKYLVNNKLRFFDGTEDNMSDIISIIDSQEDPELKSTLKEYEKEIYNAYKSGRVDDAKEYIKTIREEF